MIVNGDAFKKIREEIRKNSSHGRGNAKQPGVGTQEWLAALTGLSSRLIQRLERGEASIDTIDAVSIVLKINGREFIEGYGENYVSLDATGYIDLRPAMSPRQQPETFGYSALMVTIDPMVIQCRDDDFACYKLKKIKASLLFSEIKVELEWAYRVKLVSGSGSWLSIKEELHSREIITPSNLFLPIMFKQSGDIVLSWDNFVREIEQSNESLINLEVTVEFENFYKILKVGICIELLKFYFSKSRLKYNSHWPYRSQLKAMVF